MCRRVERHLEESAAAFDGILHNQRRKTAACFVEDRDGRIDSVGSYDAQVHKRAFGRRNIRFRTLFKKEDFRQCYEMDL